MPWKGIVFPFPTIKYSLFRVRQVGYQKQQQSCGYHTQILLLQAAVIDDDTWVDAWWWLHDGGTFSTEERRSVEPFFHSSFSPFEFDFQHIELWHHNRYFMLYFECFSLLTEGDFTFLLCRSALCTMMVMTASLRFFITIPFLCLPSVCQHEKTKRFYIYIFIDICPLFPLKNGCWLFDQWLPLV